MCAPPGVRANVPTPTRTHTFRRLSRRQCCLCFYLPPPPLNPPPPPPPSPYTTPTYTHYKFMHTHTHNGLLCTVALTAATLFHVQAHLASQNSMGQIADCSFLPPPVNPLSVHVSVCVRVCVCACVCVCIRFAWSAGAVHIII